MLPIAELAESTGHCTSQEAYDYLTDLYQLQGLSTKERKRFEWNVRFARQKLITRGWFTTCTIRGVWPITDKGRKALKDGSIRRLGEGSTAAL